MLCWAVHGVQYQGRRSGVDKLVLCSSWYDDKITCLDVLVFAVNGGFAFSGCKSKDLVNGVFL
jgi:hypothetical protein